MICQNEIQILPLPNSENKPEIGPSVFINGTETKSNEEILPVITKTNRKISGIYKIVNRTNGKYYVGSSNNIKRRWINHKYMLNKNYHDNKHLQSSWNKYGSGNFEFIIVEYVSENDLIDVEQKYLDVVKIELNKTYNVCLEAGRIILMGNANPAWKEINPTEKEMVFEEYKCFGNTKAKGKATELGIE